jgi:exodeoxyribonuclease V alpha subunit
VNAGIPLSPLGAARERFLADRGRAVEPGPGQPVLPARIVEAGRARDGGPESLQLAWEIARCAPSLDADGQRSLALLALAVLAARAEGSTRVPLAAPALGERLASLAARPAEIDAALRLVEGAAAGGPGFEAIGGPDEFKPLVRTGGYLYAQRMLRLEDRVVEALRGRLARRIDGLGDPAAGAGAAGHRDSESPSTPAPRAGAAGHRDSESPSTPATGAADRTGSPRRSTSASHAGGDVPGVLAALLARPPVIGTKPVELSDEQQRAVLAAIERPLAVISGGPGTGKTSIVVSILRALVRLGVRVEAIALAAPTGKAANRMDGAIRSYLEAIPDPAGEDAALLAARPEPKTLHRLLGWSPSAGRFRHHENNPLAERVVIVDEASMIDLFVIERLLRAVRPDAHLVLLGDADQLPSVEAGAVFRDLLPPAGAGAGDPRVAASVRLTRSYRMDPSRPAGRAILTVARAIQAGRLEDVLDEPAGNAGSGGTDATAGNAGSGRHDDGPAVPRPHAPASAAGPAPERVRIEPRSAAADVRFERVELLAGGPARHALLERWFDRNVRAVPELERRWKRVYRRTPDGFPAEDRRELAEVFRHHESFRILCLARGDAGGTGAEAVNELLHRFAGASGSDPIPGEPVLVRRNDYERGLFNGDQGLVLRVSDGGAARAMAVFPVAGGYEAFPLDAMRGDLDLAWAMTVHRSQGSEFDRVLVLLPDEDGPLVTRELIYTAATRARESVVFVGPRALLAVAAGRPIARDSGIGPRLATFGDPP